jgi:hypothetical protein
LTCATRVEVSRAFWRKTCICYGIMSMPHISSSFCHDLAVIGCLASVWKFVLLIASLRLLKPSRERVMDWVVHCLNAWMPESFRLNNSRIYFSELCFWFAITILSPSLSCGFVLFLIIYSSGLIKSVAFPCLTTEVVFAVDPQSDQNSQSY